VVILEEFQELRGLDDLDDLEFDLEIRLPKRRHDFISSLAKRLKKHGARVLKGDGFLVIELNGGMSELRKVIKELRRFEREYGVDLGDIEVEL
jgi:hypothetical protein